MMKSKITHKIVCFLLICFTALSSCKMQKNSTLIFKCGKTSTKLELPEIKKTDEYRFDEGISKTLITVDNVIVEYYCAGNYSTHIDNKNYKTLSKKGVSKRGINVKTKLYWREDNNLIYSGCKASDTIKYNKYFDYKIITKKYN